MFQNTLLLQLWPLQQSAPPFPGVEALPPPYLLSRAARAQRSNHVDHDALPARLRTCRLPMFVRSRVLLLACRPGVERGRWHRATAPRPPPCSARCT